MAVKRYKGAKAKADLLFSKIIRSQGFCEADGYAQRECKPPLQTAHIISRKFGALFADTRNAYCLCAAHHRFFHDHPREFSRFISGTWGQNYYDQIFAKAKPTKIKEWEWQERVDFLKRIESGEITIKQARELEE
jgi:hypothetical protein